MLRVNQVGICGSDVHIYNGQNAFVKPPIIQGHEFSGTVVETGKEVTGYFVGDVVSVEPTLGCMECDPCKGSRRNQCDSLRILGCQADGALAEYISVPAYTVHKFNGPFANQRDNYRLAALGEPAAVGIHSARQGGAGKTTSNRRYFVIGAGIIGFMAMNAIKYLDPEARVVASDMSAFRLKKVRQLGAADEIVVVQSPETATLVGQLRDLELYGNGFDVVIDAVGAGNTLETAIHLAKKGSGTVVQLGITPQPQRVLENLRRETRIVGSRVYNRDDFTAALDMLKRRPGLQALVTPPVREVPLTRGGFDLESVEEAIVLTQRQEYFKVFVEVDRDAG